MAWRIHDSLIRGEIDNRQPGVIRGQLWLKGLNDPIVLDLKGNACADLAGCLLTFHNPKPAQPLREDVTLAPVQHGVAGDITASRKVRRVDTSFGKSRSRKKKTSTPDQWANCLYLEWFSQTNGRVVLETTDFVLTVSAPEWRLSPADEQKRQSQSTEGFNSFLGQLSEAIEAKRHEPPADKEWDEFDYEKFMRESDARTDKYAELLDRYLDHPDRDKIIAKEMGWSWLEEALEEEEQGKDELPKQPGMETENSAGESDSGWEVPDLPGAALEPDPATEGVDWVRDEFGHFSHPLALRAHNGSMDVWRKCQRAGPGRAEQPDVTRFITEYQITAAKLAGALDGLAYGRDARDAAFTVAYLKRALNHLHNALAALDQVVKKALLPGRILKKSRAELFDLREQILKLMQEFRKS